MADEVSRIEELPSNVQTRIASSAQILSLNHVILELIKNSLDANASEIEVCLDLNKGFCSVLDNGHGIRAEEFLETGGLARLHHTSKSSGRYGCFLALLSAVSVLSIFSKHQATDLVHTLVLKDGSRVAMDQSMTFDMKIGTRVVVHNLFGNLPVRTRYQRQRYERRNELERDLETLKMDVVALLLAAKSTFSIRVGQCFDYRVPQKPDSLLDRFVSVMTRSKLIPHLDKSVWKTASAQTTNASISAVFCLHAMPTRSLQFISLWQNPLSKRFLYDQINSVFTQSDFGSTAIDKWPVFHLSLTPLNSHETSNVDNFIQSVVGTVYDLVSEFLTTQGYLRRPPASKSQPTSELQMQVSPFDVWSRIKSAKSIDHNAFVSGLPFLSKSVGLDVNARTGMALPGQDYAHAPCRSMRNITETANVLREKWCTTTCTEVATPHDRVTISTSISKNDLQNMRSIAQLDNKFILATLDDLVVVIDQHAADERIKVEEYFSKMGHETTTLQTPMIFEIEPNEVGLCEAAQPYLSSWGIEFVVKHEADFKAVVCMTALPALVAERCQVQPQKVIDIVREEIWKEKQRFYRPQADWLSNITHCPQGILDMLVSRACRSAIMFNDVLTAEQTRELMQQLSKCQFPFQCAHGRPSMTLLTQLCETSEEESFGRGWRAWKDG